MTGLVLDDVAVFDGTGAAARPGMRVEIAGGRVAEVGPGLGAGAGRDGRRVIALGGATVLPGLIDLHVHVGLTRAEALSAATGTAARVLGLQEGIGRSPRAWPRISLRSAATRPATSSACATCASSSVTAAW